ncbi:MAG TPA: branched-chain amino acid ABC transporter permease [Bellilinea sp.]|nr:branched-chain amino acid ABC transporter permease [Bellilinea sp.]
MLKKNRNLLLTILAGALLLAFTLWMDKSGVDRYFVRIMQYWAIYIIFGTSFQLLYGYSGMLSLGHAGLIAIGAYAVALLTTSPQVKMESFLLQPPVQFIAVAEWPFLPALIAGAILAAIIGSLVATPALRLGGDYLAIVTLGFAEVIRLAIVNIPSITNGAMGLRSVPLTATVFSTWAFALVSLFVFQRFESSSYGRALLAIKEDEIGAEALGINIFKHKVMAFVVSSLFAGIGGGLMASILGTIDPNTFKMALTNIAVTIVVLGGMRSLTGVVIASGIYVVLSEFLRIFESPMSFMGLQWKGIGGIRVLIFGVMLVLIILFVPHGMFGDREFSWDYIFGKFRKWFGKKPAVNADSNSGGAK